MRRINENLSSKTVELHVPRARDLTHVNHTVKGVFSQSEVKILVPENRDCALYCHSVVMGIMRFKGETITYQLISLKLPYCIFQPTCFKRNYRSTSHKELVLNYTTWFKSTWH